MEHAEKRDDWESLMLIYLHRRWRRYRLRALDAPPEILRQSDDDLYRKVWRELHRALKLDFGDMLCDARTVDFLQKRMKELATQIGYSVAAHKAQEWAAPCESCEYHRDPEDKDLEVIAQLPLREILDRRCTTLPILNEETRRCGPWSHKVLRCSSFEVRRYLAVEHEETEVSIRSTMNEDFEYHTIDFEAWLNSLNIAEQLLD